MAHQWVLDRRRFFPVAQKCGQEALAASSQRLMAEAHFPCRYAAQLVMEVEVEVAQLVVEVVLPWTVEGQMVHMTPVAGVK